MNDIVIRAGNAGDFDFIITCILEAESAGKEQSSYQKIFNMSALELRESLRNMLEEDAPGCEINCNNYFIAISDGIQVGGAAAWMEGEGMQGSNTIRAGLFSYFIPREKWEAAQANLKVVSQNEIPRTPLTLQFEDAYVSPAFRGSRIIEKIFKYGVQTHYKVNPELKIVQGFTLAGNIQSLISMKKMKWKDKRRITFEDDMIKNLLPGSGKIQWELDVTDPVIIEAYGL